MLVFNGQQHWMSKSGTLAKRTSTFRRPEFLSYDWYVRITQLLGGLNSLSFVATLSVCNVPEVSLVFQYPPPRVLPSLTWSACSVLYGPFSFSIQYTHIHVNGMCCESLCVFHSGARRLVWLYLWNLRDWMGHRCFSSGEHFHYLNGAHLPTLPGPSYASSLFVMALWHPRPMSTALAVPSFYTFVLCVCSLHETSSVHWFSSFLYILHEPNHPMCPEESEMQKNRAAMGASGTKFSVLRALFALMKML